MRVGVLFVHGIGEQKRGETLTAAGEPLFRWFRDWFGTAPGVKPPAEVRLEETMLRPSSGDPDAPPHTWLRVRRDGGSDVELLLAEAHWADAFPLPRFSEVARWALLVLPWTIATQFATRMRRVLAVYPHRLRYYPLVALELLAYVGAFLLSALVELLVLALLVFAVVPIPRFRDFIVGLQLKIAAVIGDSYVLLRSPIREDVIVSRVVRDVRWLTDRRCDRIALVAHSQGGAVAHRVVRVAAERALRRVALLLTFGSGLAKLHDIEANSESPNLLWVGWWVLVPVVVTVLLTPAQLLLQLTHPEAIHQVPLWQVLAGGFAPVFAVVVLRVLHLRMKAAHDGLVPVAEGAVSPTWVDLHASQDPVPGGPLLDALHRDLETVPVFNRHAFWSDHTGYWQNQDGFVTEVARRLADLADLPLAGRSAGAEKQVTASLAAAAPRRRWRVWWLVGFRAVVVLNAVLVAWWLSRQGALAGVGEALAAALGRLAPAAAGLFGSGPQPAGGLAGLWHRYGETAATLAAVALFHLFWYRLGDKLWGWWGRRDLAALHACRERGAGGAPFGLFLATLLALPAATALLGFAGGGVLADGLSRFAAWPRAVHLAVVIVLAIAFIVAFFTAVWAWSEDADVRWPAGLPAGFFALVLVLAIDVPVALWVGFEHPGLMVNTPGEWGDLGLGTLVMVLLMVVPASLVFVWFHFVWWPARRSGSRWLHRLARWTTAVPAWLAARSVAGPVVSHPRVEPHSPRFCFAVALVAAAAAVAASYSLYRGWLGLWGLAVYLASALVAVLMAWSLGQRLDSNGWGSSLAWILMWLPYWALFVPQLVVWWSASGGG